MEILSWIILGLIAGVLVKWVVPGSDPGGIVMTTVIANLREGFRPFSRLF